MVYANTLNEMFIKYTWLSNVVIIKPTNSKRSKVVK